MYEKYFEQLKEECLIRNRSSKTAETYIANISSFMKWTGNKPMEELSLQDAREFILFKRKCGVSASTCNFYNSSIAFLYKHVLHIPWDQDVVPRMRIDARLPEVLSLEEVETLIETASHNGNSNALICTNISRTLSLTYNIMGSDLRHTDLGNEKETECLYDVTVKVYRNKGTSFVEDNRIATFTGSMLDNSNKE